jgi:TrmH family RNA methyltransferase
VSGGRLVARYREARKDGGLAVLEGFHALKHALRFGAGIEHAATPDPAAVLGLAERFAPDLVTVMRPAIESVPAELFAALAPAAPATPLLALARRPRHELAQVLDAPGPLVLLEAPSDLGNIGAVVRTAAAAGAAGVLTVGGRLDPWHPTALRAAAGLHFALPVLRLSEVPATGRPLVAVDAGGAPLPTAVLPDRPLLAFGTERHGLSPGLRARAACSLAIPMRPGVSSLNLGASVAVLLFHLHFRHLAP